MTPTEAMKMLNLTHWMVVADYAELGGPSYAGELSMHFDDACDVVADRMWRASEEGKEAACRVYQLDFVGGRVTDVTPAALARIEQWLTARRDSIPAWLRDMKATTDTAPAGAH